MAGFIYLDDGRQIYRSSLALSSTLFLISRHARRSEFLWKYLFDKSERCAPFLSMDLRLLSVAEREMFWVAATRAYDELMELPGSAARLDDERWSLKLLHDLVTAKADFDAGIAAPDTYQEVQDYLDDLDQLWMTVEELDVAFEKQDAEQRRYMDEVRWGDRRAARLRDAIARQS